MLTRKNMLIISVIVFVLGLTVGFVTRYSMIRMDGMNKQNVIASTAEEIRPPLIGTKIPVVTVKTVEGKEILLYDVISKKPTILVFYRGGWCPYCNLQLNQLQAIEAKLINLGYQIVAISADKPEKLKESIDKDKLKYMLLSDNTMKAAEALGIAYRVDEKTINKNKQYGIVLENASGEKHHILPVPAVFVLGIDGTIIFSYVNPDFKVRLQGGVLLAAANAALKR